MAKIIIQSIGFSNTPSGPQTVDVKYRLTSDPDVPASYTDVAINLVVPVTGYIDPDLEIDGLLTSTTYTIAVTNKCSGVTKYQNVLVDSPVTFAWVEDTYTCETDEVITEVSEFTNFSSPAILHYEASKNRVYVVDFDDVDGNVQWFDPNTFAGAGDMTVYAGIKKTVYSAIVDKTRKKIYLVGQNTGGMMVYDIALDTLSSVVPYGADVAFGRLFITLENDNRIYCSYSNGGTQQVVIINPDTLSVISTIDSSTVPSGSSFLTNGYRVKVVDGNVWSIAGAGRAGGGVAIYNSTFTTLLSTIALPGSATVPGWGSSAFWGNCFYDEEKDRFYVNDIGSSKLYIIDTTSNTIVKTFTFTNREGKAYAEFNYKLDENTNKLFLGYRAFDTPSDATSITRSYLLNRDTLEIEVMLPDLYLGSAEFQTGTPLVWSCNAGLTSWNGGAWATDGIITKLTY